MEIVNTPREELIAKWQHVLNATRSIFTWTNPGELARLAEYASMATRICELGSYHGKSALTMGLANRKATLTCIDNFENAGCEIVLRGNLSPIIRNTLIVKGTSERLVKWGERFDFCFIDAGHLFENVRDDIAHLLPLMLPGSVMSGHDWNRDMADGVNRGVLHHFPLSRVVIHETLWAVQL